MFSGSAQCCDNVLTGETLHLAEFFCQYLQFLIGLIWVRTVSCYLRQYSSDRVNRLIQLSSSFFIYWSNCFINFLESTILSYLELKLHSKKVIKQTCFVMKLDIWSADRMVFLSRKFIKLVLLFKMKFDVESKDRIGFQKIC